MLRQLSKGRLSKETFVRGDFCPTRLLSRRLLSKGCLSKGLLSKETFVQGDYCPRRLLSKETIVQGDICPSRLLSKIVRGHFMSKETSSLNAFFFYWNTTICEILISTWTIVSLDKSLLGQKSPWTIVSLDNCLLGQMSPWTIVFLGQ